MAEELKDELQPTVEDEKNEQDETTISELTKEFVKFQQEVQEQNKKHEKEKRELVRQILDGGKVVEVNHDELAQEKKELINKLKNAETMSNLDVWTTSLRLRNINLELTGKDDYQPDNAVKHTHGNDVAKFIGDLIKDSKGSAATFNGLYSERVKDDPLYVQLASRAAANKR